MKNISQYIMFALIAAGVVVFLMAFSGSYDAMIYYTYILFGVSTVLALIAAVLSMVVKPETIKSTMIGVGAMLLVFGISYGLASDEVLPKYGEVSPLTSRLSGAGLYAFYILFFAAFAAIVFSGVMKLVKK